jgi:hypothetical protein
MLDFQEALQSLPKLNVQLEEWVLCLPIITALKKKNGDEFQKALEKIKNQSIKKALPASTVLAISNYLDAWEKSAAAFVAWYNIFAMEWYRVTRKDMGAESLVPFLIECMPNDLDMILSLQERLSIAAQIDIHKEGCIITQLSLAAYAALIPPGELEDKNTANIKLVIEQLNQDKTFIQLQLACVRYKAYLKSQIDMRLNQLYFVKNGSVLNNNDPLFKKALKAIQEGTCALLVDNDELIALIQKYLMICDIKVSLYKYKTNINTVITEFEMKYDYFIQTLKTKHQPTNHYAGSSLLKLFSYVTPVDKTFASLKEEVATLEEISADRPLEEDKRKSLATLIDNYEQALHASIHSTLTTYLYYKKGIVYKDDEAIFNELRLDTEDSHYSAFLCDKSLIQLFDKVHILADIKHSFEINDILSFREKFIYHQPYLASQVDTGEIKRGMSSSYVGLLNPYRLFSATAAETEEAAFIRIGSQVVTDNQPNAVLQEETPVKLTKSSS